VGEHEARAVMDTWVCISHMLVDIYILMRAGVGLVATNRVLRGDHVLASLNADETLQRQLFRQTSMARVLSITPRQ